MVSKTNEKALEDHIERSLTGSPDPNKIESTSSIVSDTTIPFSEKLYETGTSTDFDREFAIDKEKFWRFLKTTQGKELKKLSDIPNYERLILERLDRKIKKDGIIKILKKGLSVNDAHFNLLYCLPYNDLNPEVIENYNSNIFSVTRQVHYSENSPLKSIDMVLFINGLPVVTLELKNPWTGQNVYHAMKQYRDDREPQEPLFHFGRCLVHFAVDPDNIYMATKLEGKSTYFLPFNKGNNFGKGNPPNPNGYKTSYLWEDILTCKSLTNIIENYAKFFEEKDSVTDKTVRKLIFPRYHQLDVVRKILTDVKENGVGRKYLIQHSAGSGKSHSITWTAYQLVELYDKTGTQNIFDSVIVVTDRRLLDKQIKENIKSFSEVKNIVAHAENSQELKQSLEAGKKLIISTIQKFPFIFDAIQDLSDRKFAVIIDEAHSSQSGLAADKLNITLSNENSDDEIQDIQDIILNAMENRRMSPNASFLAFTATPKNTTLEKFGIKDSKGKFKPFGLYSMKQAIEEGFIMDVLANYTTYKSYYEIQKSIKDNPLFDTVKAQKKLRSYVESHNDTINEKAKIMMEHYIEYVWKVKKLKGNAKAMVVTRNIESAIRYYYAIKIILKEMKSPFKPIIAFSGKKTVDGIEHTEDSINGFAGKDISINLKKSEYKILVVANKFLTGFDEPLLHTMYVDKKLQGVMAVQALSRLNRCNNKMNKDDTFILDFYNSVNDIKDAFDPFYTSTSLSQPTDINILNDLKEKLDEYGIYEWSEIKIFNEKYFRNADAEELHPIIDIVVERFDSDLDEEKKIDFKIKAKHFVKVYGQIACLIPKGRVDWEMLYWFTKFLIPELKVKNTDQDKIDELLNSVDLSTYGLERVKKNFNIGLDQSESEVKPPNPNPRGFHGGGEEKDLLDDIIKTFNEKFFSAWDATPEEQRIKFINIARHVYKDPNYKTQVVDNVDEQNSRLALEKIIKHAVSIERKHELDLYKRYATDDDFKRAFDASISRLLLQSTSNDSLLDQIIAE